MIAEPDELYYREVYWAFIEPRLTSEALEGQLLDAGCGSGRLSVPLAQSAFIYGGSVLGIDFVPARFARETSRQRLR